MADYTPSKEPGFDSTAQTPRSIDTSATKEPKTPDEIVVSRKHAVLSVREDTVRMNQLCNEGGAPYIEERLYRHAYESPTSWSGDSSMGCVGRKQRASYINYAGRITKKIEQFVFSSGIKREGADEKFMLDASADGKTINMLMSEVSEYLTTSRWCWIHVDRDAAPQQVRSMADRENSGDRIFWQAVNPLSVLDWSFDAAGKLRWLISGGVETVNDDPFKQALYIPFRVLWFPGGGVKFYMEDAKDKMRVTRKEPFTISAQEVPFVLVGNPSAKAWWYDSIELVQKTLLNLESTNQENLVGQGYPQLVLPADVQEQNPMQGEQMGVPKIVGNKYPITETEQTSGISRYLSLSGLSWNAIPDEIMRLRGEMFETAGQALKTQSLSAQSGESKAWDHLDTETTIRDRATVLEEAETKAVRLSMALDTQFKEYEPVYPQEFNIIDFESEMRTLVGLDALAINSETAEKVKRKAAMKIICRIAKADDETLKQIEQEIDDSEPADGMNLPMERTEFQRTAVE